MRKLFVSNMMSLDGYFEDSGKGLGWFTPCEEFFEYARNMLLETDTIVFGRLTYQMMEAYWTVAKNDDPVITEKMNNLPKVVFSKTLQSAEWYNTTLVKSSIEDEIIKLKQQPGKDMVILGSGEIVSALTQAGLIDEYRIIVVPVILGSGNPLFKGIDERLNLSLLQTKIFSSGTVVLYYQPEKNSK